MQKSAGKAKNMSEKRFLGELSITVLRLTPALINILHHALS